MCIRNNLANFISLLLILISCILLSRWFAEIFKDFAVFHNARTWPMKKKLFEPLHDIAKNGKDISILEIGAGSGANLEFYPENTKLTVVDPNPFFKKYLDENLEKHPHVTLKKYIVSGAENMKDVPDKSVEVVVSTLVLCSCDEVQNVYKEICRVLAPGGKFYYMEHVIDDKPLSLIKAVQILGSRVGLWPLLYDGCRPDKDLEKELHKAGFSAVDAKRFNLDLSGVPTILAAVCIIMPHLFGTATAPR